MIELPEAIVLARQLNESIGGKKILNVTVGKSPHKFAWYYGDPQGYQELLSGKTVGKSVNHGGLVEINAEDACLLFGDGVNLRYYGEGEELPDKHQLQLEFEDDTNLVASVQMYGGLGAFREGENDNKYYLIAREKPNPLSEAFSREYFYDIVEACADNLSLKALLATEQRIPGLGNGVLQDILFNAGLHPKKKVKTMDAATKDRLYCSIKDTLARMSFEGGRDTEKDLYDCPGGYRTITSKNTVDKPCSVCGTAIKKEAYMGGSIYYCGGCQSL